MASSSRSTFRLLSTNAIRSQAQAPEQRLTGLRAVTPHLDKIAVKLKQAQDAGSIALRTMEMNTRPAEIEGRKPFQSQRILTPDELTRTSLYAPQAFRAKPPLLGPKTREARKIDPFHITRTSPLDHVFNPLMGQAFINQMGRIESRAQTGLTWKSQRAAGKLVRRQRAMGIIGQWSSRPPAGGFGNQNDRY